MDYTDYYFGNVLEAPGPRPAAGDAGASTSAVVPVEFFCRWHAAWKKVRNVYRDDMALRIARRSGRLCLIGSLILEKYLPRGVMKQDLPETVQLAVSDQGSCVLNYSQFTKWLKSVCGQEVVWTVDQNRWSWQAKKAVLVLEGCNSEMVLDPESLDVVARLDLTEEFPSWKFFLDHLSPMKKLSLPLAAVVRYGRSAIWQVCSDGAICWCWQLQPDRIQTTQTGDLRLGLAFHDSGHPLLRLLREKPAPLTIHQDDFLYWQPAPGVHLWEPSRPRFSLKSLHYAVFSAMTDDLRRGCFLGVAPDSPVLDWLKTTATTVDEATVRVVCQNGACALEDVRDPTRRIELEVLGRPPTQKRLHEVKRLSTVLSGACARAGGKIAWSLGDKCSTFFPWQPCADWPPERFAEASLKTLPFFGAMAYCASSSA